MGLIEAWGTGIKRIREEAAKYKLRDPEFLEFDDMFRINLYRYTDDANDANRDANDANHDANDTDQFMMILAILEQEPQINQFELASRIGVSRATIQRVLKKMVNNRLISRIGSTRGYWQINR
jgi:predicted HTH transcriptional regulator